MVTTEIVNSVFDTFTNPRDILVIGAGMLGAAHDSNDEQALNIVADCLLDRLKQLL